MCVIDLFFCFYNVLIFLGEVINDLYVMSLELLVIVLDLLEKVLELLLITGSMHLFVIPFWQCPS